MQNRLLKYKENVALNNGNEFDWRGISALINCLLERVSKSGGNCVTVGPTFGKSIALY